MPPALFFLRPQLRFFSTTRAINRKSDGTTIKNLGREIGPPPAHPYPARTTYKQSNYGLYGGTHIQYGNKVSEKHGNKSRRFWRPNIQSKRLWSAALRRMVRVRVQARVLRTIDKVGGLDEYLLGNKPQRIKELGVAGWALRWSVINTPMVQKRFQKERKQLGVPSDLTMKARLKLRDELRRLEQGGRQSEAELVIKRPRSSRGYRRYQTGTAPLE